MELQRLGRRLFYRWTEGGTEIEYPTDLPDPTPEIKCDEILIDQPPPLPNSFRLIGVPYPNGQPRQVAGIYSWAYPTVVVYNYPDGLRQEVNLAGIGFVGQPITGNRDAVIIVRNAYYITPGITQVPRRDLLVGSDRLINPTLNTPCPTWRLAGGNCPPNSLDCGNCCLDCAAVKAGIQSLTTSLYPVTIWRPPNAWYYLWRN